MLLFFSHRPFLRRLWLPMPAAGNHGLQLVVVVATPFRLTAGVVVWTSRSLYCLLCSRIHVPAYGCHGGDILLPEMVVIECVCAANGRFEIQPPRVSSFKYTTNFCLVTLLSSYSRRIALLIHSSLVKRSPFGEIFFTSGTLLEHVTIMSLFFFSQNSHLSMEDLRDIYACSTSPVVYCFPNDSTPPPPLTHTLLLSVTILLLCS